MTKCPECGEKMELVISNVVGYTYKCNDCGTVIRVPINTLAKRQKKIVLSNGQPITIKTTQ